MPANIQVILQQDVDKVGKSGEPSAFGQVLRETICYRASSRSPLRPLPFIASSTRR